MATQNHYCVSCTSHFLKILTYPFYLFPLFHLLSPVADAQPILFFSSRNAILILLLSSSLLLQLKSSSCSHQRLQRKSLSPPPLLLPASSFQRFTFTLWNISIPHLFTTHVSSHLFTNTLSLHTHTHTSYNSNLPTFKAYNHLLIYSVNSMEHVIRSWGTKPLNQFQENMQESRVLKFLGF